MDGGGLRKVGKLGKRESRGIIREMWGTGDTQGKMGSFWASGKPQGLLGFLESGRSRAEERRGEWPAGQGSWAPKKGPAGGWGTPWCPGRWRYRGVQQREGGARHKIKKIDKILIWTFQIIIRKPEITFQ